ncbi:uncharacterized protein KY384_008007 [Bacidia gigantensis]|uniref:uncharacterized protein n=1 Tax=Bacidia gigantensis TaxID=2732470 RepID=UPI001D043740|nr:uncharacterized protein KY384_008007 [Bacidia gigantensis]KAG8527263.1 hypothetical protein KY384_008007 [Bacidia gigantensis]
MKSHEEQGSQTQLESTAQPNSDNSDIGQSPPPPPDKGLQAWLQVAGVFFCWFNSWSGHHSPNGFDILLTRRIFRGLSNAFGVFQTYYEQELPQSPSVISWIGSIQALLLIGVGILAGPAYDAGFFTELIWTGTVLVPFGFMMTSLASKFWQIILAQGVIVGIGMGCLFIPSVSILPQWFSQRRVLANALAASGASFGGTIYPILLYRLLNYTSVGFPWAVRILGFFALGTSLVSCALLKVRSTPPKRRLLFDFKAYREPPFALYTISLFFALIGIYIPTFYIQLHALKAHSPPMASTNMAAYILPILNAGAIPGRIVPGFVANKTGVLNLFSLLLAWAGIVTLCWPAVTNLAGLIVYALVYGFAFGGILSLPPPAVMALSPDLGVVGTRFGTCVSLASFGVLIGTPIGGAILHSKKTDITDNFLGLQLFAGLVLLIGAGVCLLARSMKVGWELKGKI